MMNGSTAKRLKKIVYGDFSPKDVNYTRGLDGSLRCVGRRAAYQRLKKNNCPRVLGDQFNPTPKKRIAKGKNRPRWLIPGKRDQ
jgi:hypothetical protein